VWDGNHQLQAWMPYISRVHPYDLSWHIIVDFHHVGYKKGPHPPLHYNDKHEHVRFKLNIMNFKILVLFCYYFVFI
jgi:hypothetical protein